MKRPVLVVVRCALVAATCGLASFCSATAIPDPVIWYDMESVVNGKVPDKSGNGRDLTLGSGATLTNGCGGATGTALFFDGTTSAYSTFQSPALGSRTIAFWFRRENSGGPMYDNDNTKNRIPYLLAGLSSVSLHFGNTPSASRQTSIFSSNSDQKGFVYHMQDSESLGLWRGCWEHVAITLDETSVEISDDNKTVSHIAFRAYVNGSLVLSPETDFIVTNIAQSGTVYLGNRTDKTRPIFGAVDEFRVWNTALDAEQIKSEYERMSDGYSMLLGHWTFDDATTGSGSLVLPDSAGMAGDFTCGSGIVVTNAGIEGKSIWCNGYKACWGSMSLPFVLDSDFTWTCWVNQSPDSWKDTQTKIGGSNNAPRLINEGGNWWFINMRGGNASEARYCGLRVRVPGTNDKESPDMNNCRAPQGAWSHLAVTERFSVGADGQRRAAAKIYMNGELAGEIAERDVGDVPATAMWYIGNYGVDKNRPFEGMIDDLRLYKGAISTNVIRCLYRGAAAVDAGEDFVVAGETAELHGEVGVSAPGGIRAGYAGTPQWSLVTAPIGGEGATILQPNSPATCVTLPVVGSYVFRLSNVLDNVGLSCSDDVTVVRTASAGVAPTVSASSGAATGSVIPLYATATPGARVRWTKVSGPGGVWFSPGNAADTKATFGVAGTYVVRCTAEKDGSSATSDVTVTAAAGGDISDGLIRWWPLAAPILGKERIGDYKTISMSTNVDGSVVAGFVEGPGGGYAMRPNGFAAYFELGNNAFNETMSGGDNMSPPQTRYRGVSCWVWHDSADTNTCKQSAIFMQPYSLGLWYDFGSGDNGTLTLYQQGSNSTMTAISNMKWTYSLPVSLKDRWTHVYVLFDRNQRTDFELWIDGVKQMPISSTDCVYGRTLTSRPFCVGGIPYKADEIGDNGYFKDGNTVMSRCFPGRIADVRIYGRKLLASEITKLAANPDVSANLAPLVDAFEENPLIATTRKPATVETAVFDDGEPVGSSLTYQWSVLSGDASKVTFGDATARETTFTASKNGTYVVQLAVSDGERMTYSQPLTVDAVVGFVLSFK